MKTLDKIEELVDKITNANTLMVLAGFILGAIFLKRITGDSLWGLTIYLPATALGLFAVYYYFRLQNKYVTVKQCVLLYLQSFLLVTGFYLANRMIDSIFWSIVIILGGMFLYRLWNSKEYLAKYWWPNFKYDIQKAWRGK